MNSVLHELCYYELAQLRDSLPDNKEKDTVNAEINSREINPVVRQIYEL